MEISLNGSGVVLPKTLRYILHGVIREVLPDMDNPVQFVIVSNVDIFLDLYDIKNLGNEPLYKTCEEVRVSVIIDTCN